MTALIPEQVQTPAEFIAALRALKERLSLSYRNIERRAREAGDILPVSTVQTTLGRASIPRLGFVSAFARACGEDPEGVDRWVQAHQRLVLRQNGFPGEVHGSVHTDRGGAGVPEPMQLPADTTADSSSQDGQTDSAGKPGVANSRPRQLPMDIPTFVGRREELSNLLDLLDSSGVGDRNPVVVIHGAAGVGKSALAVRAAHLMADAFPDGQLYVNLRGAMPGSTPLEPLAALVRFLRAFGLDRADLPHEVEECAALYRTVVAGRRLLVILDDAACEAQVRPLLPGGHDTATVITSRVRLAGLQAAAHQVLGLLDHQDAYSMLKAMIGESRTLADPAATRRLAELCGFLPLGLGVAASRLKVQPTWRVADLVNRLSDDRHRLDELRAGDVAVPYSIAASSTALATSAEPLDQSAAAAFPLLGLLPSPDIDLALIAAMLDVSRAQADRIAERLSDAHLLESVAADRYRMHDLVRLVARQHAEQRAPAELAAALTRVLIYYVSTAGGASRLVHPHRLSYWVRDGSSLEVRVSEPPGQADQARKWLEDNRERMLAVVGLATGCTAEHARRVSDWP